MKKSRNSIYWICWLSFSFGAFGANIYWKGMWGTNVSSEWTNPANWDVGVVPGLQDLALIHGTTNPPVIASDVGQISYLALSWHPVDSRLTLNDGGKLQVRVWLTMGNDSPSSSRLTLNSGSFLSASMARLGVKGTAEVRLWGGTLEVERLEFGQDADPNTTGTGYISIKNNGRLVLLDDRTADVQQYIANGWIYSTSGRIYYDFNETYVGRTTVTANDSFQKAWRPVPAHGKDNVPVNGSVVLTWMAGDGATQHDVYVGTDYTQVLNATPLSLGIFRGRQSGASYMLSNAVGGQTYYWRIDEVVGSDVVKGDVWQFTTIPLRTGRDLYADTWVAADDLNRFLGGIGQYGAPRSDRLVGIYYCVWHKRLLADTQDMTQYLLANPNSLMWTTTKPGDLFWWDEPLFGYYMPDDPWVIRKHLAMLHHAGVDVLIFEATNAIPYIYESLRVLDILQQMKNEGLATNMKFVYWTHTDSPGTATAFYNAVYARGLYSDLWFYWDGKPLILGYPDGSPYDSPRVPVSPTVRNFFTWRKSWFNVPGSDLVNQWQWADKYPQDYGYATATDKPESVSITPATHPTDNIGKSYQYYGSGQPAYNQYYLPISGTEGQGIYLATQVNRAMRLDPPFLFVTGWNEWLFGFFTKNEIPASKWLGQTIPNNNVWFTVDLLNREYNRDLEPCKGGYKDNYYHQLVDAIRRYKGVRPPLIPSQPKTITIDGQFADWQDVRPEYRDLIGDTVHRSFFGHTYAGRYVNTSGRNDIITAKTTYDSQNVYFYVQTNAPISSYVDPYWMMLFINTDQNYATGWKGYDFIVNRFVTSDSHTTVVSGSDWTTVVANVSYRATGNQLELAIPRSVLGLSADPVRFDFKWADNIQTPQDVMEFWVSGDAAPDGRFNYRFDGSLSSKACQRVWSAGQGWPADLNQDCQVEMADLVQLAQQWLSPSRDLLTFDAISESWLLGYLPTEMTPVVVFSDNFESGTSQWDEFNWTRTTANSFSPAYAARVQNATNRNMHTKPINLQGYSAAQITFRYRLNISSSGNGIYVMYNYGPAFEQRAAITNTESYWQNSWQYYSDVIRNEGDTAKFFHSAFRLGLIGTAYTLLNTRDIYVDDVKIIAIP